MLDGLAGLLEDPRSALGSLWNGYIVLVHATAYGAGVALLLPALTLLRLRSAAARTAIHGAVLIGMLLVSLLCFAPVGWWAWVLPDAVAAPLFWIGASGVAASVQPATPAVRAGATLYLVWMAGGVVMLARLACAWITMAIVTRRATPNADGEWNRLLRDAGTRMGTPQIVSLRFSSSVHAPVIWGVLDPVILLPTSAEHWNADERRMVLLHELAHVRRGDALVQLLAALARAWYWFHPVLLWSARELRAGREEACDALVLGCDVRRSDYASCLLHVAASVRGSGRTRAAALAMAESCRMERRVRQILLATPARALTRRASGPQSARVPLLALAACIAWALVMGTVRLAPRRSTTVAALASDHWPTRAYAARLLSRTMAPSIRAALHDRAAHDPHPVVRRMAAGHRSAARPPTH